MKSKIIIFILVGVLSIVSGFAVFAEERGLEGSITLTGRVTNIAGNRAKFNEYRDLRDGLGAYSQIDLNYDKEKYFLDLKTEDIGYDTQSYRLGGGLWGKFKTYLYYYEIPHNITFDAITFYGGAGSDNLTYPSHPPSTNTLTWDRFDYSTERRRYGGGLGLDWLKPFYLDFSIQREEKEGIKPSGVAGAGGGNIAIELPEPVDYKTDTITIETGYSKNPLFLSLGFNYSQFNNSSNNLFFRNPFSANTASSTDFLTLPPDNDYYKIRFKGSYRLPLQSRVLVNLSSSRAKSEESLFSYRIDNVPGGRRFITLSDPVFNGKVDTRNYSFVLTSNPVSFLDGKIFFKHYKKDNKSDEIITRDGADTYINHLFGYKKNTYGAELGLRLPAKFYLSTSYNFVKTKREREDLPENKDDLFTVDLRWSGLDFMVVKVGYEGLYRDAKFRASTDPNKIVETYVRRFDAAAMNRITYKASIDLSPIENLNLGIGYKLKNTDYKDVILGLQNEKSNEFTMDGDYTIGKFMKIFSYLAFERIKSTQFQRQFISPPAATANPFVAPTTTNFNWDIKQKDRELDYGIGSEIYIIPNKLTLTFQHDYVRSNGSADLTYFLGTNPLPAGRTQDNIDISDWDDYRLKTYLVKATYNLSKSLSFTVGGAYEKFRYKDAQVDGYQYLNTIPGTGTNSAYLTGAYRAPSNSGSIVFLGATYKF